MTCTIPRHGSGTARSYGIWSAKSYMNLEEMSEVRLLVELTSDDGHVLPTGTEGVISYVGSDFYDIDVAIKQETEEEPRIYDQVTAAKDQVAPVSSAEDR